MSSEDGKLVERIAFCSILCAGFVYAGYNVFSKVFQRKSDEKPSSECSDITLKSCSSKAVQTEEIKSVLSDKVDIKSVKERIKDLNLVAQSLRKNSIPLSPETRLKGLRNSPWSSPLGCAKYLSVSAENINLRSCSSPEHGDRRHLAASQSTLNTKLQLGLSTSELSEYMGNEMLSPENCTVSVKTLNNLQKMPSKMTSFEARNIVILLHSQKEDILLKTLYTISNCAAFTTNQELLCDSDCPAILKELLLNESEVVKVATTQAISNLAVIDKSNKYFQSHIPILLHQAMHGKELLKSLSLTALANLAIDPASHRSILVNISGIMQMVRRGTSVVQLQSLRLLVNLSCNRDAIPSLLITEVPCDVLDIISEDADREVILRILTFLANVVTYASQFINDAPKPTLTSVLYKSVKKPEFSDVILKLSYRKDDEDVSYQAERLYHSLLAVA